MRIVVDDQIPFADAAFASFGRIDRRPGRAIDRDAIRTADALIVRTITRVDRDLVADSRVRFVGSATIGTDHVALPALREAGIAFAHAPGCNANAVAEHVLVALHQTAALPEEHGASIVAGVVGHGAVGRRVAGMLRAIGARVEICDPPLHEQGLAEAERFVDLSDLFARCSIVSLHTPLTSEGPYATRHMIGESLLASGSAPRWLVNTSRGAVVNERAFLDVGATHGWRAIWDVWEHEPELPWSALARGSPFAHVSPHVAGYSFEGKVAATLAIHRALAEHLGTEASWDPREILGPPGATRLDVDLTPASGPTAARRACLHAAIDLATPDADLRAITALPPEHRAPAFDALRRGSPHRRELGHFALDLRGYHRNASELESQLRGLGFAEVRWR